eukprot:TRINITY_DN4194_c0_g1_i2.p1 TRINITY_DN4194_c0_g1~~TRINITY_DN4194_c0_g1_i2.p1  ORF type:complete len:321 (+),score=72.38 TRINITY_DN4194_c0_g1_i2:118-1080(+)
MFGSSPVSKKDLSKKRRREPTFIKDLINTTPYEKIRKLNNHNSNNNNNHNNNNIEYDDFIDIELPSDLEASMIMLQHRGKLNKLNMPVILKSQIYSMFPAKDYTNIEIEIQQMIRNNKIKIFKITNETGNNQEIYMFTNDYSDLIKKTKLRFSSKYTAKQLEIYDMFISNVIPYIETISITQSVLISLLFEEGDCDEDEEFFKEKKKLKNQSEILKPLTQTGILLSKASSFSILSDEIEYYFGIPLSGSFFKQVIDGRKEILTAIRRKRFKEYYINELKKRTLKKTNLGVDFHLKDLIGLGYIEKVQSTTGELVRIPNNA